MSPISTDSCNLSASFSAAFPEARGGGGAATDEEIPCGAECSKVFHYLYHCSVVGLCMCSHLLHGEADTWNLLCSVFIMDFTKVFCLVTNASHIYDSLKMSALVTVLWKTTAAACPFCHLCLNLIWYIDYLLLILILIG